MSVVSATPMLKSSKKVKQEGYAISVIIPSYNRAHCIVNAVNSVLAQTYGAHEIIVVDDGSQDETKEVLKPYWDTIKYVYQKNGGIASARNTGIQKSTGNYIALLDSDDLWEKDKLAKQVEFLQNNADPKLGMIDTYTTLVDEHTGVIINKLTFLNAGDIFDKLLYRNVVNQCSSVVIKREVFERVGLFNERRDVLEDREMWFRIADQYHIYTVPHFLNIHMRDEMQADSLSSNYVQMQNRTQQMWNIVFKKFSHRIDMQLRKKLQVYSDVRYIPEYLKAGKYAEVRHLFIHSVMQYPALLFGNHGKYFIAFCASFLGPKGVAFVYKTKRHAQYSGFEVHK